MKISYTRKLNINKSSTSFKKNLTKRNVTTRSIGGKTGKNGNLKNYNLKTINKKLSYNYYPHKIQKPSSFIKYEQFKEKLDLAEKALKTTNQDTISAHVEKDFKELINKSVNKFLPQHNLPHWYIKEEVAMQYFKHKGLNFDEIKKELSGVTFIGRDKNLDYGVEDKDPKKELTSDFFKKYGYYTTLGAIGAVLLGKGFLAWSDEYYLTMWFCLMFPLFFKKAGEALDVAANKYERDELHELYSPLYKSLGSLKLHRNLVKFARDQTEELKKIPKAKADISQKLADHSNIKREVAVVEEYEQVLSTLFSMQQKRYGSIKNRLQSSANQYVETKITNASQQQKDKWIEDGIASLSGQAVSGGADTISPLYDEYFQKAEARYEKVGKRVELGRLKKEFESYLSRNHTDLTKKLAGEKLPTQTVPDLVFAGQKLPYTVKDNLPFAKI